MPVQLGKGYLYNSDDLLCGTASCSRLIVFHLCSNTISFCPLFSSVVRYINSKYITTFFIIWCFLFCFAYSAFKLQPFFSFILNFTLPNRVLYGKLTHAIRPHRLLCHKSLLCVLSLRIHIRFHVWHHISSSKCRKCA